MSHSLNLDSGNNFYLENDIPSSQVAIWCFETKECDLEGQNKSPSPKIDFQDFDFL